MRFLTGILAIPISCPLLVIYFYSKQEDSDHVVFWIVFLFTMFCWRVVYLLLLKTFSKNAVKRQASISTFTSKNAKGDFVVFLRPFTIDSKLDNHPIYFLKPLKGTAFGSPYFTLEQEIDDAFKSLGLKTVAITDNKSYSTRLGIERFKSDNKDWQIHVSHLIKTSKYICLLGNGDGSFQWELNEIIQHNYLDKTLIFYPVDKRELDAFLLCYKLFPIPVTYKTSLKKSSVFGGLLYFDTNTKKFEKYPFKFKRDLPLLNNITNFLEMDMERKGIFMFNSYDAFLYKPAKDSTILAALSIDLIMLLGVQFFIAYDKIQFIVFVAIFISGFSPGNLIFQLTLRDFGNISVPHWRTSVRNLCLILLFQTIKTPVLCGIIVLFTILIYLKKKRLLLLHQLFSGTKLFSKASVPLNN